MQQLRIPRPGWLSSVCREEENLCKALDSPFYAGGTTTYALPSAELQIIDSDQQSLFSFPTGAGDLAIDIFLSPVDSSSLRRSHLWRLLSSDTLTAAHTTQSPFRCCLPWLTQVSSQAEQETLIGLWHAWSMTAGGVEDWVPLFQSRLVDPVWIPVQIFPKGWVRFTWPEEVYTGHLGEMISSLERGGMRIHEFHLLHLFPWGDQACWLGACRVEGQEKDIQSTFQQLFYFGLPTSSSSPLERLFLEHHDLPLMGWPYISGQLDLLADLFALAMPQDQMRQRLEGVLCSHPEVIWASLGVQPDSSLDLFEKSPSQDTLASICLEIWEWAFPVPNLEHIPEALVWRLDPHILHRGPWAAHFPQIPFAIFYVYGGRFYGFHIRFMEIARGGFRTLFPETDQDIAAHVGKAWKECYDLAWTQQLKNKEIPEGGSKALLVVTSGRELAYKRESAPTGTIGDFWFEIQRTQRMERAQKAWVTSLLKTLMSTERETVERIYLGPDEGMSTAMIEWIAEESVRQGYPVGHQLMSGKSVGGIHHKKYGVTSLGLHEYLLEVLMQLGWRTESFTVKMTGGPDGDVAGNEIRNLIEPCPHHPSLILIKDRSGLLYDPVGLDGAALRMLVEQSLPVSAYPKAALHEHGFLLTMGPPPMRDQRVGGSILSLPIGEEEAHELYNTFLHRTYSDFFLPCGGRPGTLSKENMHDCWSEERGLSSLVMIEGANLYPTAEARHFLEEKGMWIIKDSSANKGGVMSSSLEILGNMALGDALFEQERNHLIPEVLQQIRDYARQEAQWLFRARAETGLFLTDLSLQLSQLLLERRRAWLQHLDSPLKTVHHRVFLASCLPLLREKYGEQTLERVPAAYQKAAIATFLSCSWVYHHNYRAQGTIIEMMEAQRRLWQLP